MLAISIIYPMSLLLLLTASVLFMMLFFRVKAVRSRKVSPRYFKLNKGAEIPDHLEAISQNFNNLLQLPVIFYVVCLLIISLNLNLEAFTIYTWSYVIFRYLHSFIHLTSNNIIHRLFFFTLSCITLIVMWIKVVVLVI